MKNWFMIRQNRTNKVFYKKYKSSQINQGVKTVKQLPTWFFDLQQVYVTTPKNFELDYFTLSVLILHDEIKGKRWTQSRAYMFDNRILNMYNWKYIT